MKPDCWHFWRPRLHTTAGKFCGPCVARFWRLKDMLKATAPSVYTDQEKQR